MKKILSYLIPPPPRVPKKGITLAWIRSMLFWLVGRLGDLQALSTADPERILKRAGNKLIGRNVTRNIYLKKKKGKRK